jgi:uncharacterized protein (DUF1330 family)
MSAYVIVNIEIHDPTQYETYKQMAPSSITAFGGRYLVRGGPIDILEGRWTPRRVVLLEFPNKTQAHLWWNSSEYEEAKSMRHASAYSEMIVVEGVGTSG